MSNSQRIQFQNNLLKYILGQENRFLEFGTLNEKPTVILCDRGALDIKAYMEDTDWQILMDEGDYNIVDLRDRRYDGIIHMVTAADGAAEHYNLGNKARSEDLSKAIELDKKLQECWVDHP
mmetsp:Transcript_254/g.229  ORF Transcript_254/g.229 Transcript_254/m.229 type:complete len:121 (+) Transcript_254:471-833(+)